MAKNDKKSTAPKQEQESPAAEGAEQPTAEEQLVELEGQLTVSNNARNELEQHLAETNKARKDLEQQLTNLQAKYDTQSEELEQLKASQATKQEPEKPKVKAKITAGDCRDCVHFPENVSEDGRAAEDWVTRTHGFIQRPCGIAPCESNKFARK